MRRIGTWNGEHTRLVIEASGVELNGRDGVVVVVQHGCTGTIVGATEGELPEGQSRH